MTQIDFLSQRENNDERINTPTSPDNSISTSNSKSYLIPIRIITHNIRYATTSPFKGEEPWSVRCPLVCSQLVFNSILPETFISLQEVLHSQLMDINDALNDSTVLGGPWSHIGVGRDDGEEAGEYSPIFYRPDVWQLLTWKTVWLSETPDKPSIGVRLFIPCPHIFPLWSFVLCSSNSSTLNFCRATYRFSFPLLHLP
jgi:hypothetical protein